MTATRIIYAVLALYKSILMSQEALLGCHTNKGIFGTIESFYKLTYGKGFSLYSTNRAYALQTETKSSIE